MTASSRKFPASSVWGLALLILSAVLLAGCMAGVERPQPTSLSREQLPTIIALTIQALETPFPTLVDTPVPSPAPTETAASTPTPEPSPTLTLTPTATDTPVPPSPAVTARASTATRTPTFTPQAPVAGIQILRPGPASKVVSPLRVSASLFPGARGNVRLELLGEDGRVLVRRIQTYQNNPNARVNVNLELEFEIAAVAEAARLIISTEDSQGRLISLASLDLILLSLGENEINPAGDLLETIVIRDPRPNLLVQGGELTVSGLARPRSEGPLLVQLINTSGKQVSSAQLIPVESGTAGMHFPFSIRVPYSVASPTWVRLWISERDYQSGTILSLSSVEVLLSP